MQFKMIVAGLIAAMLATFCRAEHRPLKIGASAAAETFSASPAGSTAGSTESHPLDANDLRAWLDGMLPYALKSGDIAGAVVAVVKDGKVLLQGGYGYADVDRRIPMDPQRTMIRPGSTSKLFTWTAVMQLVEQGKIDLDRNVDDYLDFKVSPSSGPPITMRDLMNHRAGFEEGLKDILVTDPRGVQSTETYLKQHPRPLLFTPGAVPAYSNYGAALAGYIVQRVSGQPFERYVEQHIFLPLGMRHSTFDQPLPERFSNAVARGYRTASTEAQPYELIITRPAGSMTTTAWDMTRFMLAHLQQGHPGDYDMLRGETAQLMHSPSESSLPGFGTMAHGFFYATRNGRIVIGHGGDTVFFHTELDLLPQEGVGIFYNFNSRGRDGAVYGLRQTLFDEFMDRYFPRPAPSAEAPMLATAAADAQRIAGRYQESRRVEHGFLSFFYLLQQTVIRPGPDGTILAPGFLEPGESSFREVAPDVWREARGTRELALLVKNGSRTVIDSDDPTSVFQPVPALRSAPLNVTILLVSLSILVLTALLWPISVFARWHSAGPPESPAIRRLARLTCTIVVLELCYLLAWMVLLAPVLSLNLWVYSSRLDPAIRALQLVGVLIIAATGVGIWTLCRLAKLRASRFGWVRCSAVAAALLGVVWIGFVGRLFSFDLNY